MTVAAPAPETPCPDHSVPGCTECFYDDERRWIDEPAVSHNSPAVVAEDLRALAEVVPFDEATRELLELAAELLDPEDQHER